MVALRRMWIRISSDKRRFGALVVVAIIGILLWARIIIVSKPPQRAIAEPESALSDPAATKSDAQGVSDSRSAQTFEIALASRPARDPFSISPEYFPRPTPPANSATEQTKSTVVSAEDVLRAEAQRTAQLVALAERLTLEAVMKGGLLAVIDGRTVQVGGTFTSKAGPSVVFTLSEVRERSVIIECEGRLLELRMP